MQASGCNSRLVPALCFVLHRCLRFPCALLHPCSHFPHGWHSHAGQSGEEWYVRPGAGGDGAHRSRRRRGFTSRVPDGSKHSCWLLCGLVFGRPRYAACWAGEILSLLAGPYGLCCGPTGWPASLICNCREVGGEIQELYVLDFR